MNEIKSRILLAEDDENLGSLLQEYLQAKNYETDWVTNGEKAFRHFEQFHYDLCLLDIMMPIKDGFTLASEIRILNNSIPIIFLTAKSMKEDVLEGFTRGADDYMTKPFSMEELLFRIEAILRRGVEQKLTTKESELLKLLCNNLNQVLERNFALKAIWIDDNYFNARSMDVYITKLRKYLKSDPSVQIINVHGKGYKLVLDQG
jgi:two-component system OmpR family response regulator